MRSTCLAVVLIGSRMSFRLVPKSVTLNYLERRNSPLFILRYFTESDSFRAHCVKAVDKAITINNVGLLCLVGNVCRGTARRPLSAQISYGYISAERGR